MLTRGASLSTRGTQFPSFARTKVQILTPDTCNTGSLPGTKGASTRTAEELDLALGAAILKMGAPRVLELGTLFPLALPVQKYAH